MTDRRLHKSVSERFQSTKSTRFELAISKRVLETSLDEIANLILLFLLEE